jgi:CubicO group peptidase (beta-lactamase class C family)
MLEGYVIRNELAGISAAISREGNLAYRAKYGWQDKENGVPLAFDSIFRIMSMTKPVTAVAAMLLYEQGHFDLNTPISDFLPAFENMQVFRGYEENGKAKTDIAEGAITFRHLFTHTSGLSYGSMPNDPIDLIYNEAYRDVDRKAETIQTFVEKLAQQPLAFHPGTQWRYGFNLDVLGALVEVISGMGLEDFMQENIFKPLNMDDTTTLPLNNPLKIATPYERWYSVLTKSNVELPLNQRLRIGGGGIYSTVDDLANFLIAQMNQGNYQNYQLLNPETIRLMHSKISNTSADFMQEGYGYGWGIFQDEPRQMWDITFQPRGFQGHGGRYFGYSSAMYMVEEEQRAYGYIMLANHSMVESFDLPWVFAIQNNIQDLILQEAYEMYQDSME